MNVQTMQEKAVRIIGQLRQSGFFKHLVGFSNDALVEKLHAQAREEEEADEPFDLEDEDLDLYLAEFDTDRVLCWDLDAEVSAGNEVYVDFVEELSELSDGYFDPTDIKEIWETEIGPVSVSLTDWGDTITLHPDYKATWLDAAGILPALRDQMIRNGAPFQLYWFKGKQDTSAPYSDLEIMIVRATEKEKSILENNLGWILQLV